MTPELEFAVEQAREQSRFAVVRAIDQLGGISGRLFLISSPEFDVEKCVAQHKRVIDAAAALHVRQVAYTSFLGADTPSAGGFNAHYLTERALERCGLAYT